MFLTPREKPVKEDSIIDLLQSSEIEFETWCLKGNVTQETLGFFMGSKPLMNTSDPVTSDLDNRKQIISKPGPTVHLNVEVLLRNFTFHSLSGVKTGENEDI